MDRREKVRLRIAETLEITINAKALVTVTYAPDAFSTQHRRGRHGGVCAGADPVTGLPFSSRHFAECLTEGARRFAWDRRSPKPQSMQADDGLLIGLVVAFCCYRAVTSPVIAQLRVRADGTNQLRLSGQEKGRGIRSEIVAAVAARLDIDRERFVVVIGQADAAPQHLTAGSCGIASVVPALQKVVEEWLRKFKEPRDKRDVARNVHQMLCRLKRRHIDVEMLLLAPGHPSAMLDRLPQSLPSSAGPEYPEVVSLIALFVEVRVEPTTWPIRVACVVCIADCGSVVSPGRAVRQAFGGVLGIGDALREIGEQDPRYGGLLDNDLADYAVPVDADIKSIEVGFFYKPKPLSNAVGGTGLGEVAMVGVAAAIAMRSLMRRLNEFAAYRAAWKMCFRQRVLFSVTPG